MKRIGIERSLNNVKEYLESNNLNVEVLEDYNKRTERALNKFDAIVVTGADENLMGIQNTVAKGQIINAEGKTAEEVYGEITKRLR